MSFIPIPGRLRDSFATRGGGEHNTLQSNQEALQELFDLVRYNQKQEKKKKEKPPFSVVSVSRLLFSLGESLTNPLRLLPERQLREKFIDRLLKHYGEYDVYSLKDTYLQQYADERALPERIREVPVVKSRVWQILKSIVFAPYYLVRSLLKRRQKKLQRQLLMVELEKIASGLLTEISSSYGHDIYIEQGKQFEIAELILQYIEVGTFKNGDRTHLAQSIEYSLDKATYSEILQLMQLLYIYQENRNIPAYEVLPQMPLMQEYPDEARQFLTMILAGMMMDLSDEMVNFLMLEYLYTKQNHPVDVQQVLRIRQYVNYGRKIIQKRQYEDKLRDPLVILQFFYEYIKMKPEAPFEHLVPRLDEDSDNEQENKKVALLRELDQKRMDKNYQKTKKKCLSTAITVFVLKILSLILLIAYDMALHGSLYLIPLVLTVIFSLIVIYGIGLSQKVSDWTNFEHLMKKRNHFFGVPNPSPEDDIYEDIQDHINKKQRHTSSFSSFLSGVFRTFTFLFSLSVTLVWAAVLYFLADGLIWVAQRFDLIWLEDFVYNSKDPVAGFTLTMFDNQLSLLFNFSLFLHDVVHIIIILMLTGFAAGSALKIKRWRERKYIVEGFNLINFIIVVTGLYPLTVVGNALTKIFFKNPPWYLLTPMEIVVNNSTRRGGWFFEGLANFIIWLLSPFARLFQGLNRAIKGLFRAFLRMIGRKL